MHKPINIFDLVDKQVYDEYIKNIKDGEIKSIYNKNGIQIDIQKIGKKVYKFINESGKKSFEDCLKNMYRRIES